MLQRARMYLATDENITRRKNRARQKDSLLLLVLLTGLTRKITPGGGIESTNVGTTKKNKSCFGFLQKENLMIINGGQGKSICLRSIFYGTAAKTSFHFLLRSSQDPEKQKSCSPCCQWFSQTRTLARRTTRVVFWEIAVLFLDLRDT